MSETVDKERAQEAERQRNERAIRVLEELLAIVKARRDGTPMAQVAVRLNRDRMTVWTREKLLRKLLGLVERKGARHP